MRSINISSNTIDTDDAITAGFDFIGLKNGGMLKVQGDTVDGDLTIKGDTKYVPPGNESDVAFAVDLDATKEGTTSVTLSVEVERGVTPYTYQWFKDDAEVSGATSSTYNATASGAYKVEVTDGSGTKITSKTSTVTVYAPLAFTTNLASSHPDVYLGNGETFGPFSVAVSGGKTPRTYQWKRATANVATGTTFGPVNVDDVFPSNGSYNWSCVVTDSLGNSITSNIMPAAAYRLPSFTTQPPATLDVDQGAAISIVTAPATTSKPARTYQWYKDDVAISGATSATYSKSSAVADDAGTYYVIQKDANNKSVQSTNCVVAIHE